ncbi:MAG TPA: hypothetical protein VG711_01605 [Phycisphaerales bacterium]|nr:hypothetical protein [Phycisphaerales bacterium]
MNPIISNPFFKDSSSGQSAAVGTMRALRSEFRAREEHGAFLQISPMRAAHVFEAIRRLEEGSAFTLVTSPMMVTDDSKSAVPTEAVLSRLGIAPIERVNEDAIVLDDADLMKLIVTVPMEELQAVRVQGPVEVRDAKAMVAAIAAGVSPLSVEMRATSSIIVHNNEDVSLECTTRQPALAVVSEDLRHYLSALTGTPAAKISPVPLWQIDRMVSLTGRMMVRPIESQSFSTFIDIGVNTSETSEERPADRCLIYDLPSNSWHDEA